MTRPGRTTRNGHVVPWVVDWDKGRTVAQELGLDPNQVHAHDLATLGQAVNEQAEAQAQDQTQAQGQGLTQALDRIAWFEHNPWPTWDQEYARHRDHRHARNESCTEEGPGPDQGPTLGLAPEVRDFGSAEPNPRARSSQRRVPSDRDRCPE